MAKPELGTKRECPECAVKYYDLGRIPCVCPKCSASFEPDAVKPARAPKVVARVVKAPSEDKKPPEEAKTVSQDQLGTEEQEGEDNQEDSDEAALADIDIPDDDDDDDDETESNDAFLDTEDDDNTDVSGLLGSGIGKGNEGS